MTTDNFYFYLQNRPIQTSQTGGQQYSDTALIFGFGLYCSSAPAHYQYLYQGILKGEVSLYCWPPVWLVWDQLYDYWQFLFLFAKQTNPNQSNRRSVVRQYCLNSWIWTLLFFRPCPLPISLSREYYRGKYHCTVDLLFWLVWISLFCKYKQKLSVVIQLIPNQSNRRSTVQWYFRL